MPPLRLTHPSLPLRRALFTLVVCAATFGVAASAHAAQPRPLGLPSGESLLFVLHAESGSLVRRSANRYTLTLRDSARQTTWFADRPNRDAGRVLTRSLVRNWNRLGFAADRPNAALSTSGRGADDVIIELGRPRIHRPGLTLKIPVRTLGRRLPGRRLNFTLASLFIDNASVGDGCGQTGQITFTSERLAPRLLNGVTPADGRWVSIAEYPDLYKYYGNFFGGDSTSFRLPDVPTPPGLGPVICVSGEDGQQPPSGSTAAGTCEPGRIELFLISNIAKGYVPAEGQLVNIRDHPGLFDLLHNDLGGDGTLTFRVPRFRPPPGMTWQICSRSTSPTPTCFRGEIGYHALEVDTGPGSSWVPATGRLYPVNANLPLFSLFATDFGGDGRVTFGVPDVADPAPGVHPSICWSGPFPELAPPQD